MGFNEAAAVGPRVEGQKRSEPFSSRSFNEAAAVGPRVGDQWYNVLLDTGALQ